YGELRDASALIETNPFTVGLIWAADADASGIYALRQGSGGHGSGFVVGLSTNLAFRSYISPGWVLHAFTPEASTDIRHAAWRVTDSGLSAYVDGVEIGSTSTPDQLQEDIQNGT